MSKHSHSLPAEEPLRVLHVVSGDLWAGAEVQVWQLLRAAVGIESVELHAVVLNPGELADRLNDVGVRVTILNETSLSFPRLTRALRKLARNWRPSVIHTHRRKEHLLGALAGQACGAALVATVHGRPEFTCSELNLRQQALRILENTVLAKVHDRLVAVSDDLAGELPGGPQHAVVIPNSVDVESVRSAAQGPGSALQNSHVRIGFLGRLVRVKQVDRMLEMMVMLEAERPGHFALHIVGDGPLSDSLQAKAQDLGLDGIAFFHGFKRNPLTLLARMSALLFASVHEGLPMTALEALALGVPLISPPIESLSRLISESGMGQVAASAEPRDLSNAVLALNLHPEVFMKPRPSRLPTRYQIERGLEETLRLWRELACRHRL